MIDKEIKNFCQFIQNDIRYINEEFTTDMLYSSNEIVKNKEEEIIISINKHFDYINNFILSCQKVYTPSFPSNGGINFYADCLYYFFEHTEVTV